MKALLPLLFFVNIFTGTIAQNLLFEDFSGSSFPPTGWSIDDHASSWSQVPTSLSWGSPPEARLGFSPSIWGTTRLISPSFDLTGVNKVMLDFNFRLDTKSEGCTIGAATRHGAGAWTTLWSYDFSQYSGSWNTNEEITITNADVNNPGFQFCLFLTTTLNTTDVLTGWYLDNVHLFKQAGHDACIDAWWTQNWYNGDDSVDLEVPVRNRGTNGETFPVTMNIYDFGNNLIHSETKSSGYVGPNNPNTVNYSRYKFPSKDAVYKIQYYTSLTADQDRYGDTLTRYTTTYTHSRQKVLTELITATDCGYCPSAEKGIDEMLAIGDPVAPLAYHVGDLFQSHDADARANYYGYYGTPTAIFDGVLFEVGGFSPGNMFSYYQPLQASRQLVKTNFGIEIHGTQSGGNYNINAVIDRYAPYTNKNLWFQLGLAKIDSAMWWMGDSLLTHIERKMVPNHLGTVLDLTQEETKEIDLSFFYSYPTLSNLELIAFIQDTNTREVLDAERVIVSDLTPLGTGSIVTKASDNLGNPYPNPMNGFCRIPVNIDKQGMTDLTIYNFRGEKVNTVYEGTLIPGTYNFSWNGADDSGNLMPDGLYLMRMNRDGETMSRKILLVR